MSGEPPAQDIHLEVGATNTTVAVLPPPQPQMVNNWQHGLCGCFDNAAICAITYFVPCVTYGQVAKVLGKSCIVHGLLFAVPILNWILWLGQRGELRRQRGIIGSPVMDCCIICWCTCCALSQEGQEAVHMETEARATQAAAVTVLTYGAAAANAAQPQYAAPGAQGYPSTEPAYPQGYPEKYPPGGAQGYPPQAQGYPPQAQGYPPQEQGYPPQAPPQEQAYPTKGAPLPDDSDSPPGYNM